MSRSPHVDQASEASADSVTAAEDLAYQEERRRKQYEAIYATSVDLDDEDDPQVVLAELKAIRKEMGNRLRGG
ncbi:hypothetical protein [Nocardia brasiliensis]